MESDVYEIRGKTCNTIIYSVLSTQFINVSTANDHPDLPIIRAVHKDDPCFAG